MEKLEKYELYFTVYWFGGEREYIKGASVGDALNKAGHADRRIHQLYGVVPGIDESLIWTLNGWVKKAEGSM
jgi:hypothetical protein